MRQELQIGESVMAPERDVDGELVTLANHARVWIRPLREGEEQQVRELLFGLDAVSWYNRFLSPYPTAIDLLVRLLSRPEGEWGLSLVAEALLAGCTRLVGIANVARSGTGQGEVGLLIPHAWQRQHVGTELVIRALHAAEVRGMTTFVAHMGAQNIPARRLLAKVGVVRSVRFAGRTSEYSFVPRGPTS
jgi:RimJ/RimL family protein N-acetyltransferase